MSELPYLSPFVTHWPGFAAAFAALLLLGILASAPFRRWRGEAAAVRTALRKLDPKIYHVYHDLRLPRPDRQGQIEVNHVVVSPFGIFVIKRVHFRGLIFGSANQCLWTQRIRRHIRRFDNPLPQNRLHVRALAGYLGLAEDLLHPATLFVGNSTFKTPMPDNVLNGKLHTWIKRHTIPLLDPQALYRATSRFDSLSRAARRPHSPPHQGPQRGVKTPSHRKSFAAG